MPDDDDDLHQQAAFSRDTGADAAAAAGVVAAIAAAVAAGYAIGRDQLVRLADQTGLIDLSVMSSCIASLSYRLGSGVMVVTFRDGSVYDVPDVSVSAFLEFLNSRSKGAHWNAHFRGQSATQFAGSKKQRIKLGRR